MKLNPVASSWRSDFYPNEANREGQGHKRCLASLDGVSLVAFAEVENPELHKTTSFEFWQKGREVEHLFLNLCSMENASHIVQPTDQGKKTFFFILLLRAA